MSQQQQNTINENKKEEQHYFVVRFSSLGDVTLTSGVLSYWQRIRGARFTVLTRPEWAQALEGHPAIDKIETIDFAEMSTLETIAAFRKLAALYQGVTLIDLHNNLRSRLLSAVWRGPVKRYPKYGLERRLFLLSGRRLYEKDLLEYNVPQRYALALDKEAPPRDEILPKIWLTPEEIQAGQDMLTRHRPFRDLGKYGKKAFPIIALHPYAAHSAKTWPWKIWQDFSAQLTQEGLPWFMIGTWDKGALPYLGYGGVNFTNSTDLRLTCALLKQAAILITGDSGPMHLAAAVGTPVIAMFGPTTRHWGFFPHGPEHRIIELNDPARPYSLHGKTKVLELENCLQGVSTRSVFNAVMQILASHQGYDFDND